MVYVNLGVELEIELGILPSRYMIMYTTILKIFVIKIYSVNEMVKILKI